MTTQSPERPAHPAEPLEPTGTTTRTETDARPPSERRLLRWMLPANMGMYLLWGSIPGILLPLQVEALNHHDKSRNLAIVTTIGAFAAMLAQPLAGTISDRTRSRYGKRGPWIVGGSLCGGLALLGLAAANTLVQITIAWTIVQITYNFAQGPLTAVLPDRVPAARRGVFSSVTGVGLMLGAIGGQVVATGFAHHIPAGYLTFAGLTLIALTLFVVFNPDTDSRGEDLRPFDIRALFRSFYFDPRKHPDLAWAFLGRLLLYLGYFVVTNYQLYILQDRVGLHGNATGFVPILGVATLVGTIAATIVSGPMSDRRARRRPFVYAAGVIMAVALLVAWVSPTRPGMIVFALISGIGFGTFQSVDTALVSQVLPAEADFAKDVGVINIAATLPQVVAPAVAGAVVTAIGYASLYPLAIVLVLLGAAAVAPIKSVR